MVLTYLHFRILKFNSFLYVYQRVLSWGPNSQAIGIGRMSYPLPVITDAQVMPNSEGCSEEFW